MLFRLCGSSACTGRAAGGVIQGGIVDVVCAAGGVVAGGGGVSAEGRHVRQEAQ
jgi:hypothetical protein